MNPKSVKAVKGWALKNVNTGRIRGISKEYLHKDRYDNEKVIPVLITERKCREAKEK